MELNQRPTTKIIILKKDYIKFHMVILWKQLGAGLLKNELFVLTMFVTITPEVSGVVSSCLPHETRLSAAKKANPENLYGRRITDVRHGKLGYKRSLIFGAHKIELFFALARRRSRGAMTSARQHLARTQDRSHRLRLQALTLTQNRT